MAGANSDSYIGVPPTRFPGGVNNVTQVDPLAAFGAPDPTKYHVYWEDFDQYIVAEWTLTTTEAGSGNASEAVSGADGGILLITNDNADNDNDFFQYPNETWKFVLGKKLWFKCRFKVSDATQSDVVFGLQITDTSPLAVTDGVFFRKDDDAATMDFVCCKNSTETKQTAVATLADDTYVEAAFYFNGIDAIEVWINGEKKVDAPLTNMVDDEELCVSFGIQNGAAAIKTMSVDYIFVARERG